MRGCMGSHYPRSVALYVVLLKISGTVLAIWHGLIWDHTWAGSFEAYCWLWNFRLGLQNKLRRGQLISTARHKPKRTGPYHVHDMSVYLQAR